MKIHKDVLLPFTYLIRYPAHLNFRSNLSLLCLSFHRFARTHDTHQHTLLLILYCYYAPRNCCYCDCQLLFAIAPQPFDPVHSPYMSQTIQVISSNKRGFFDGRRHHAEGSTIGAQPASELRELPSPTRKRSMLPGSPKHGNLTQSCKFPSDFTSFP